jgi:hypothetical protein
MTAKNKYVAHVYTFSDDTRPTKTITCTCSSIEEVKEKVKQAMNKSYYQMVHTYNGNSFEKYNNK